MICLFKSINVSKFSLVQLSARSPKVGTIAAARGRRLTPADCGDVQWRGGIQFHDPTTAKSDTGRFEECQIAVEDGALQLLGQLVESGRGKAEVIAAIIRVAEKAQLAQDKFVGPSVATYLRTFLRKLDE
ncbi:hypothetical protein [Phyllobacterium lublinensis]|uniref:hypothetical protein n=1 Tax=Phyllobacterium lublinensis TaxID=2875708 RepID=UPI001CCDE31C|nr:hypothetical protein [Phyllobacterium sp. 2063]MBZ9657363.1 hypothetical protein [Phyllobacterium sp. 2063]